MDRQGVRTRDLCLWYGSFQALKSVSLTIRHGQVTGLIGPSGCGKTTLLRCFNRINERIAGVRTQGTIEILGHDVYAPGTDLIELRKRVGMVFQRPNPLPLSVAENVLFGLRVHGSGRLAPDVVEGAVEAALKGVGLWSDLKDRLRTRATDLPLEQQQKLCIARLLPLKPELLLMDEPCSALDPAATSRVENLIRELRGTYTILIVTHNMAQARRVSDECIYMLLGEVIEHRRTEDLFINPSDERTARYIEGRYG
ncbi:MAG: phosphate ABC transporter ATP-binding protein [Deltaproteobacteria bacterium]|nr:phosphate ABC transporter ATP-binding protein [Deltaproteobacteria bacterium]